MLAACLAATGRVACPGSGATLRASVLTNLRQHLSPAPRHGALSAAHEVSWRLSPVEDREQLWALAHSLTQHLTQAKADRLALRCGSELTDNSLTCDHQASEELRQDDSCQQ